VAVTLAAAVQKPAAHATQEEGAVKDAPPADHVPAGYYCVAGHAACCVPPAKEAQK